MVTNNIGKCLSVCSRARTAAKDTILKGSKLVRNTISNIGSSGGPGIGSKDDSTFKDNCHN